MTFEINADRISDIAVGQLHGDMINLLKVFELARTSGAGEVTDETAQKFGDRLTDVVRGAAKIAAQETMDIHRIGCTNG